MQTMLRDDFDLLINEVAKGEHLRYGECVDLIERFITPQIPAVNESEAQEWFKAGDTRFYSLAQVVSEIEEYFARRQGVLSSEAIIEILSVKAVYVLERFAILRVLQRFFKGNVKDAILSYHERSTDERMTLDDMIGDILMCVTRVLENNGTAGIYQNEAKHWELEVLDSNEYWRDIVGIDENTGHG